MHKNSCYITVLLKHKIRKKISDLVNEHEIFSFYEQKQTKNGNVFNLSDFSRLIALK